MPGWIARTFPAPPDGAQVTSDKGEVSVWGKGLTQDGEQDGDPCVQGWSLWLSGTNGWPLEFSPLQSGVGKCGGRVLTYYFSDYRFGSRTFTGQQPPAHG
jgi:hypothetical protein